MSEYTYEVIENEQRAITELWRVHPCGTRYVVAEGAWADISRLAVKRGHCSLCADDFCYVETDLAGRCPTCQGRSERTAAKLAKRIAAKRGAQR